jgi:hypothetical protein
MLYFTEYCKAMEEEGTTVTGLNFTKNHSGGLNTKEKLYLC